MSQNKYFQTILKLTKFFFPSNENTKIPPVLNKTTLLDKGNY